MPLPENSGRVSRGLQHLRHREGIQAHPLSLNDGVRHPVFKFMPSTQQRRPPRGTGWANVKLRKQQALLHEPIHRWRLQNRIPQTTVVSIRKVVGHHDNDVRLAGVSRRKHAQRAQQHQKQNKKIRSHSGCYSTSCWIGMLSELVELLKSYLPPSRSTLRVRFSAFSASETMASG